MTIGFIIGGGVALEPPGLALYERYPQMRDWTDQVVRWSGLTLEQLYTEDLSVQLYGDDDAARPELRHVASARQAMLALGIADVLAEQGIRPSLLGGSSLGWMICACLAGAITREDLFAMLEFNSRQPMSPPGEPGLGVAVAIIGVDADLEWYCGPNRPGVHFASDVGGVFADGSYQMVMFSGRLDALRQLAAEAPQGQLNVISVLGGGHTPLQEYYAGAVRPYLATIPFQDPKVPVVSALAKGVAVTTAEGVRAEFAANLTTPAYLNHVKQSLAERGTELALLLGAGVPVPLFAWPYPTRGVSTPEEIEQAAAAVYDMGIELTFN
ncbi:ACP S-malonyltransferase [Kitasatospora sp. NPDC057500]|uniref:ACP S-malonyltransferase n=1 Tax=Kitasatospora sp. NPDC057500 TaxID=3346151 RepID=UPI0036A5F6BF